MALSSARAGCGYKAEHKPGAGAKGGELRNQDAKIEQTRGVVRHRANDQLQPVAVTTGITDGSVTQIVSEELIEETPVVVGWMTVDATAQTANPFVPRMKSNKRDNKP